MRAIILFIVCFLLSSATFAQNLTAQIIFPNNSIPVYSGTPQQEVVIETNKTASSVTVNGIVANLRTDNRYSVILPLFSSGNYDLDVVATSSQPSESVTIDSNFDFIYDPISPEITATVPSFLTKTSNTILTYSVNDSSPVRLNIYRNNALIFSQDATAGNLNIQLAEGNNTIRLVAIDRAGNSSTKTLNPIRLDTEFPSLLTYTPADGTVVNDLTVQLSGTISEAVIAATINGQPLSLNPDGQTFNTSLTYSEYGPAVVTFQFTDAAGNIGYEYLPVEVVDSVGQSEEPSVIINPNNLHSCAHVNGAAYCWGWNGWGQLGDNSFLNRSAPIVVPGLGQDVKLTKAGAFHSCAVKTDNTMRCWGRNDAGELGNRTTVSSGSPVNVIFDSPLSIQDIALGNTFTCVMYSSSPGNGIKCWGRNLFGNLGNGTTTNSIAPVDVVGLTSGVKSITTNSGHLCVIKTDDTAHCWGDNSQGKLGNGNNVNQSTPVAVSNIGPVQKIVAGSGHTCAINQASDAYCWGQGNDGQLGAGSIGSSFNPVKVINLSNTVKSISAGDSFSCAVLNNEAVKCWGANTTGQLGNGTFSTRSTVPVDVVSLGASTGSQYVVSSSHSCVQLPTAYKCWGRNTEGQLGDGTFTNRNVPVTVLNLVVPPPSQAPIVANFTADPIRSAPMMNVEFDASSTVVNSGSVSSYSWSFGDGTVATGLNTNHTYQVEGNYLVELTVTSNTSQEYKVSKYVVVEAYRLPIATMTITPDVEDFTYAFSALGSIGLSGEIVSYNWDFGDGHVDLGLFVEHEYSSPGIYQVTLMVTDNVGNFTTIVQPLNVKDVTPPVITLASPTANQTITQSEFSVTGSSNEKLSSLRLNGMPIPLNINLTQFSKIFSALQNQTASLNLEAIDLAGNVTNTRLDVTFNYNAGPFSVSIDPSLFTAGYYVNSSIYNGQVQVTLPSGNHNIQVGTTYVSFEISPSGVISNVNPAEALTVNGLSLVFNTFPITFDPNSFAGFFSVDDGTKNNQLITQVLLGGSHQIKIGDNTISFLLNALGQLSGFTVPSAVNILGSTIKFAVNEITIEPMDYTGYYSIWGVNNVDTDGDFLHAFRGNQLVKLVRGLQYPLYLGNYPVTFSLNEAGSVLSLSPNSIQGLGSILRFVTSMAKIDLGDFASNQTQIIGGYAPLQTVDGIAQVGLVNDTEIEFDFFPRESFESAGRGLAQLCKRNGAAFAFFKNTFCYDGFGWGKGKKKCKWYQKCKWGKWFNGSWDVDFGNPFQGIGDVLRLLTGPISIDLGRFLGQVKIPGIDINLQNIRIPLDVNVPMFIGDSILGIVKDLEGLITGTIDGVASIFNDAVNIVGDTLEFVVQDVLFNSDLGKWFLVGVGGFLAGVVVIPLIPGVIMSLGAGSLAATLGSGLAGLGGGLLALAPTIPFVVQNGLLNFLVNPALHGIAVDGLTAIIHGLPMNIDPSGFIGNYIIGGFPNGFSGIQTVDLIPNLEYTLQIGNNQLHFAMDSVGNITVSDPLSLVANNNLLEFITSPVNIDVGNFLGNWGLDGIIYDLVGDQTLNLVNNLNYYLDVANNPIGFVLDQTGLLHSDVLNSIQIVDNIIHFQDVAINFDVQEFIGRWNIDNVFENIIGSQTINLVKDLDYTIKIGDAEIKFAIDSLGNLTDLSNPLVGVINNHDFDFGNVQVHLNLDDGVRYDLDGIIKHLQGSQTLDLIPGIPYEIQSGGETATFLPTEAGIVPSSILLGNTPIEFSELDVPTPPAQRVWVVNESGQKLFDTNTIKKAINFASTDFEYDAILVGPGTYNEVVKIDNWQKKPLQFKGVGSPKVKAFKFTNSDVDATWGASRYVIQNFTLDYTDATENGIFLSNSPKVAIIGNKISKPAPGKNGIVIEANITDIAILNNVISGNNLNGILVREHADFGYFQGILLTVSGNEISSNGRNGFRLGIPLALEMHDNLIQNNGLVEAGNTGYGLLFENSINENWSTFSFTLQNNVITNNRGTSNRRSSIDISNYKRIFGVDDDLDFGNRTTTNIEFQYVAPREPASN